MTALPRPSATVALVLLVALAGACGSNKKSSPSSTTTPTSTTSIPPVTSTALSSTTTTVPVPVASTAIWPTVASATRFRDPVAAARSFAVDYLKMVGPVVGTFRPGDSRSGEVPIRGNARGPVTTVLVRQLGADASWWVLGAGTPNIVLVQPAALATITSPVRLRGQSTAFEATVNISIRQDDRTGALAETFTMGGANGRMGPFDASVRYSAPTQRYGAIVMYTISSETGHTLEATVIRVRFSGV